jgi:hypothetical protein
MWMQELNLCWDVALACLWSYAVPCSAIASMVVKCHYSTALASRQHRQCSSRWDIRCTAWGHLASVCAHSTSGICGPFWQMVNDLHLCQMYRPEAALQLLLEVMQASTPSSERGCRQVPTIRPLQYRLPQCSWQAP